MARDERGGLGGRRSVVTVLDTPFVLDLAAGDDRAMACRDRLRRRLDPSKLSAMTAFELAYRVGMAAETAAERRRLTAAMGSLPVLPVDERILRKAGQVAGRIDREGGSADFADCVIGATAVVAGEVIVTLVPEAFAAVPGLEIETY